MAVDSDLLIAPDGSVYGYLLSFQGTVFPSGLKTPIPPEQVEAHNAALAQAELAGLDANCEVGQVAAFYLRDSRKVHGLTLTVTTWTGTVVSERARRSSASPRCNVEFTRAGKTYRGRVRPTCDLCFFRRIK